jgi:putative molybdopterin biosynthesis protein
VEVCRVVEGGRIKDESETEAASDQGSGISQGRRTVAIVILPGFPTSAIITFNEFVAPVIRALGGRPGETANVLKAELPFRVNSERGRTEFVLVSLIEKDEGKRMKDESAVSQAIADRSSFIPHPCRYVAYPLEKGSGSVTSLAIADGFVVVPRQREYLEAGDIVDVHLQSSQVWPADLVVIGSHCTGLDYLLGLLEERGFRTKFLMVGSTGGLNAARRGECDLAGIHLLDSETLTYNTPYLTEELTLLPGYGRSQGLVFRPEDKRFAGKSSTEAVAAALGDPSCLFVNRNRGSGTRVLIDRLLAGARPPGYSSEVRSHHAVVAAVEAGRADWGVAIANLAQQAGLSTIPVQEEQFDFVIPRCRLKRPAVHLFRELITSKPVRNCLLSMGFRISAPGAN